MPSPYAPRNGNLPTRPSTSADHQLSESLSRLNLDQHNLPRPGSAVRSISRRSSSVALDFANARASPISRPHSPLPLVGGPTLRKRSSVQSLSGNTPPSGRSLSRKSSILGMSSSAMEKKSPTWTPQPPALTAVILHDSCYKHRWARPGTKKADLATVVERPERITAAILGICAAQTRVGVHKLSIHKSKRMGNLFDPEVMLVHGGEGGVAAAWPKELSDLCRDVGERFRQGVCEVPNKFHQGDLYLCLESREALEGCIGAVYDAVDAAFGAGFGDSTGGDSVVTKRTFACIRPPGHHCSETAPSGFCWLNNVHIAIAHAARVHGLTHAVILDFDLHHGDGSQAIAWTLNDTLAQSTAKHPPSSPIPQIAYLSLHDVNSYPCEAGDIDKIKNASLSLEAHNQFIHNMHLLKYSSPDEFWNVYDNHYSKLLVKAGEFLVNSVASYKNSKAGKSGKEPKAAIFLSAGFDASEHEGAGMQRHKVHVPTGFYARFAREVVSIAEDADTRCDGRVISVLEGGYSNRAVTSGVMAHLVGLAYETPSRELLRHNMQFHGSLSGEYLSTSNSSEADYERTLDNLQGRGQGHTVDYYDPSWWDVSHLAELEKKEKKPKKVAPTHVNYLSATASSAAKAESPRAAKLQQHIAQQYGPPPPPVVLDWATATFELSKKLIPPEDEDISGPPSPTGSVVSTRSVSISKRHSVPSDEGAKMTLRERKPKQAAEESRAPSRAGAAASTTGRRKTVAGVVAPAVNSRAHSVATKATGKREGSGAQTPITSRGPSPIPEDRPATSAALDAAPAGGRRAISLSMKEMPPPAMKPAIKRLDKVSSISNIREAAISSAKPLSTTKTLRRASSAAVLNSPEKKAISPPMSSRGINKSPELQDAVKVQESTASGVKPQRQKEDPTDSLVNGMKRIKITYKNEAADRAKLEAEKKAKAEAEAAAKLKPAVQDKSKVTSKKTLAPAPVVSPTTLATNGAGPTGVSAVRLAAMKLEQQQQQQQQQNSSSASKPVSTPKVVKYAAPKTAMSAPQPQQRQHHQQHPSLQPIPQLLPPHPVIVTIPPTRPATSYTEVNGEAGKNHEGSSKNPPPIDNNLLSPDYSPSTSPSTSVPILSLATPVTEEQKYFQPPISPIFTPASEIPFAPTQHGQVGEDDDQDRSGVASPPPPYTANPPTLTPSSNGSTGHGQNINGHMGTNIVGLGFNVMKPLTVGLGGGGTTVSKKGSNGPE